MIFIAAAAASTVIRAILGALGRFPLFVVAALVISGIVLLSALLTEQRALHAGGLWAVSMATLQVGYFLHIVWQAFVPRKDRALASPRGMETTPETPDRRRDRRV